MFLTPLIGYDKYHQVRERQEQSVKDLQESVNVSLMRYRGGTANYLVVLDSQRSLFDAEITLAQARNNEYQSLIELYKALGGGWEVSATIGGQQNAIVNESSDSMFDMQPDGDRPQIKRAIGDKIGLAHIVGRP